MINDAFCISVSTNTGFYRPPLAVKWRRQQLGHSFCNTAVSPPGAGQPSNIQSVRCSSPSTSCLNMLPRHTCLVTRWISFTALFADSKIWTSRTSTVVLIHPLPQFSDSFPFVLELQAAVSLFNSTPSTYIPSTMLSLARVARQAARPLITSQTHLAALGSRGYAKDVR